MNEPTKRIILKKDWDLLPGISEEKDKGIEFKGHFAGREKELELLTNEILHKNSGSILVSGHRGVGKTSLVYKALSEVLEKDKNNIIILINAAQLEAESENEQINPQNKKINPREIIENLIRRLYTATKNNKELDEEIKKDIERLYKKAVAKEFKLTELISERAKKIKEVEEEKIREILIRADIRYIVIFLSCWTIGTTLIIFNITPFDWLNKLLGLLLTFPVPYIINLTYRKREIKKSEETLSTEVSELYELDNKISNLEFDLEGIHKKIANKGKKLVYVIDELDKLGKNQVIESLKYFKHLFTHSNALFVFVGGEEIYDIGLNNQQNAEVYRAKEYTYFTTRYFLTRPLYSDLSKFFDEIGKKEGDLTDEEFEIFKRALCFDAKNDFFDLKKCIRDKITYYTQDGNPVIDVSNIPNDRDYDKKFKLHKAITVLFEDKYMSSEISKWKKNEELLRTMFNHAHQIYNSFAGATFPDPEGEDIKSELIRDFNNLLYRNGALNIQNENQRNIKGTPTPIRTYSYVGYVPNVLPDSLEDLTEYERRFVNRFEEWVKYLLAVYNAFKEARGEDKISEDEFLEGPNTVIATFNNWGYYSDFNRYLEIYKNLVDRKPPYPYKREDIEKAISEVQNYLNVFRDSLHNIIPRNVIQLYSYLSLQNIMQNAQLFGGFANQIGAFFQGSNPVVLTTQDHSRQILFYRSKINEVKNIKNVLKDNKDTHRIVMVMDGEINEDIPGLHIISINSPEKLEKDLIRLYKDLEDFLQPEKG